MNCRQLIATAGCAGARAAAPDRPNILFLMGDQFRADAPGVSGNHWIRTPNLDGLARSGVHRKLILRNHLKSELYDLVADPAGHRDLFAGQPAKVKELAGIER